MKPQIFFGSSSEAGNLVRVLALKVVEDWAQLRLWTNTFEPAKPGLGSFLAATRDIDAAVLLFSADDSVVSRGQQRPAPRDNLILELGIFLGRLPTDRVIVLSRAGLKLPSDYEGYTRVSYEPDGEPDSFLSKPALEIQQHLRGLISHKPEQEIPRSNKTLPSSPLASISQTSLVPVYRDLTDTLDWFEEMRYALEAVGPPVLNPKVVYYGPGLGSLWIRLCQTYPGYREMRAEFHRRLGEMLQINYDSPLNVVDLGIGDFEKGHSVLDFLLDNYNSPALRINYYAVDVSYEMLSLALGHSYGHIGSTLRSVQNTGQVAAINCTFSSVHKCSSILPEERSLVLLLGNTLGNELNEVETLRQIANFMRSGDLLFVEVQLLEERAPDLSELTRRFQASKFFYAAPFVVLGYDETEIELSVDSYNFPGSLSDAFASTLLVKCLLLRGKVINHPGLPKPIEVQASKSIGVQLIRKYKPEFVLPVFDAAGLKVRAQAESQARQGSRKFLYILAEK